MSKQQDVIEMTAKLYKIRDSVRSLLGSQFQSRMKEYGDLLTTVMKERQLDAIAAATFLGNAVENPFLQIQILSAAVELVEPSEVPA
ncbi:MAG: hypothetical protein JWQ10_287 [Herbaspirillum sp.]|nr:hypothetical protein [Herbaspirillum sp.]